MKTSVLLSALLPLAGSLTLPAAAYDSPPPTDSARFCHIMDPEEWERERASLPAAKRLQDLNVGEPRTVRLFYFLPNDRPYRAEVVDSMKTGIVQVQTFFADQMEAHGHGRLTFQFETDDQGNPVVHHVDGDYADSHYSSRGYTEGEIARAFDNSANIILVVMDVSSRTAHGRGIGGKGSGWAIVYGEWNWFAAAHELGHAFSLHHDFRDNKYVMSYGRADRSSAELSGCAAGFLAVHPYFNSDVPLENESPPTVELISTEYPFGSDSTPVRLRVRDDDGLHQVILFVPVRNLFVSGGPEVKACQELAASTDTVVAFDFDGRVPSETGTSPLVPWTLSTSGRHEIYVLAIDRDGNRSNPSNHGVRYVTLEAGHSPQHIATVNLPYRNDIGGMAISQDGSHLAIGNGGTVELMDAANRERIAVLRHTGDRYATRAVAFSHDGALLASGSWNDTIKVWNVNTKEEVATLEGHTDRISSVDFSPDGTLLASGSLDRTVRLWNASTWEIRASLEGHTDRISLVTFISNEQLVSRTNSGTVELWNVTENSRTLTFETGGSSLASRSSGSGVISPDGTLLATQHFFWIKLWNLETGTEIGSLYRMPGYSNAAVAFSPDGTVLALAANGLIELWDVRKREFIAAISEGPGGVGRWGVGTMLFSPNGKQLIGTANKGIKFWDASGWTTPGATTATTDFNGDGKTDFVDFFLLLDAFGGTDSRFDLDGSGTVDFVDFFEFLDAFDQSERAKLVALAQEMIGLPAGPLLGQNAPNPFNSETVVSWFLLEPGPARVEVFGLTGQRLAVLHQGPLQAGFHRIHWDGRDGTGRALASGVYLYRLVIADRVLTRKLTLLR